MISTQALPVAPVASWWEGGTWFAPGFASPAPIEDADATMDFSDPGYQGQSDIKLVGGARAQSRFSCKGHIPLFVSVPADGSPVKPHPAAGAAPAAAARRPAGRTCDGAAPPHASRWVFDKSAWAWSPLAGDADHLAGAAQQAGQGAVARVQPASPPGKRRRLPPPPGAGFARVGGMERAKAALNEAVLLPLRYPTLYRRLGMRGTRGVLLVGPPGSGKTHLAMALAEQAGLHCEVLPGGECAAGSESADKRVRAAFANAEAMAPCVLLIDELEAAAPCRSAPGVSTDERRGTARLLALLDALRTSGAQVAVVGATSNPEAVDAGARRPGRLCLEVKLGTLREDERLEVLLAAAAPLKMHAAADLRAAAIAMRGRCAADVAALPAAAALRCAAEAAAEAEAEAGAAPGGAAELMADETWAATSAVVRQCHLDAALAELPPPCALRELAPDVPADVAWEDVGGLEAVKRELREMVELPLLHAPLMARFGASPSRGALLHGPPGTGKTLLARAVAARCGANFVSVRGPQLLSKWLGESERAVRDLFASARASAPCVIFFDEIDAIGARRSAGGGAASSAGGEGAAARVLTALLAEMDGLSSSSSNGPVFVLGATNRPEALDPALLRPGRMDSIIQVPLPDEPGRLAVLRAALRRAPLAADANLPALAAASKGLSGADLAEVARRASMAAAREAIAAERLGGAAAEAAAQLRVGQAHLAEALGSVRPSVSADQAAAHDEHARRLREGTCLAGGAAAAAGGAADAAAALLVRTAAGRVAGLQERVEQLEAALRAAGLAVPAH